MATEASIGLYLIAAFMGALAYFGTRPDLNKGSKRKKELS